VEAIAATTADDLVFVTPELASRSCCKLKRKDARISDLTGE
jgi:hypothetical protein